MIAFAFCGKIGTYKLQARHASYASQDMIRSSHESFFNQLYGPAMMYYDNVHVFIHSWNPDAEKMIRDLYKPVYAMFEDPPQESSRCPPKSDCLRVYSYLKSIHKVLTYTLTYDEYDHIFLSRFDILWKVSFEFKILPEEKFVLPEHCSPMLSGHYSLYPHNTSSNTECRPLMMTSLEDRRCSDFMCKHNSYLRNLAHLDMWIIGNYTLMQHFKNIGLDDTFHALYDEAMHHRPAWIVAHTFWGLFLKNNNIAHLNYYENIDWMLSRYPTGMPPHRSFKTCLYQRNVAVSHHKCTIPHVCTKC